MGVAERVRHAVAAWATALLGGTARSDEGASRVIFPRSAAELYARKVGETQRELQARERERRKLVGVVDQGFINLEVSQAGGDDAEVARRGALIEASATLHRDELL